MNAATAEARVRRATDDAFSTSPGFRREASVGGVTDLEA